MDVGRPSADSGTGRRGLAPIDVPYEVPEQAMITTELTRLPEIDLPRPVRQ